MSISSDDLMVLAVEMLHSGAEVNVRSAIGRSYYALFHEARDKAQAMRLPAGREGGSHDRLITSFESSSKGLSTIGRGMRRLKMMRNLADYDIHLAIDGVESKLHVSSCKALIGDLRRIKVQAKA